MAILSLAFLNGYAQEVPSLNAAVRDFCNDSRDDVKAYCKDLKDLQTKINSGASESELRQLLNKLDLTHAVATDKFITATAKSALAGEITRAVASKATASMALGDAGQGRLDRQVSPGSNVSGTTSLVSKAGSSELLSLALDTGALTKSVNGTTVTLNTNADQLFRLITNGDPDCILSIGTCQSKGWFEERVLNRTTISASLDLAQQNSTVATTSGQASGTTTTSVNSAAIPTGAGKLSAITARYEVRNKFNPRDKDFLTKWQAAIKEKVDAAAIDVQDATIPVMKTLTAKSADFALDREEIQKQAKNDPTGDALASYFDTYFTNASNKALQDSTLEADILKVVQARAVYRDAWYAALDKAAGVMFTFEYNYNRPATQPLTHDLKLIFGYDFGNRGMLTFNGALSLYETIPAGAKYGRVHYGQVSTEYDRTLTGKDKSVQTQLSLAGYWQYQPEPSILNIPAGTVAPGTTIPLPNGTQEFVGTAGSLWVTQAKFTIKASKGINIPFGVNWSNKTDLLQGSRVGAQVGISYNFNSLTGLFTGGGGP